MVNTTPITNSRTRNNMGRVMNDDEVLLESMVNLSLFDDYEQIITHKLFK